ncbi:MAG: proline/glycine betaine ABC transporter permease [Thermaerobacterales bacterium]
MRYFDLPLASWVDAFISWAVAAMGPLFDVINLVLRSFLRGTESFFVSVPPELMTGVLVILAWRLVGRGMALFTLAGFVYLGAIDMYTQAMATLALITVCAAFSILMGIPLGIAAALSDRFDSIVRPVLDFMQTMPSFVYLIPVLILFGIGQVPAAIATIIFAMPPVVRLTNLGIRQVPEDLVEAAMAFGSTRMQALWKVQMPNAWPTMMAGVNQTVLMALSMSVIAAMVGARGLGSEVYRGISMVRPGLGFEAGLGIIVLAILLDRLSQAAGRRKEETAG